MTSIPCPSWCVLEHGKVREDLGYLNEAGEEVLTRECRAPSEPIETTTHGRISAEAIRLVDLVSGRVYPPEVRVNDDTLSPEAACQLAAQILAAVDLCRSAG